ncbi:MAG TPA: OB-fold domain-containing protein [Bryobacteraceae bacterium]|nr:OB-fold domain-containing protein [Bryobacteraceae bacterium]
MDNPGPGNVYTETVIHAAPEQFVADAPYQLAIITLDHGGRLTGRIDGPRVQIGDAVDFAEYRNGIPFFRKKN